MNNLPNPIGGKDVALDIVNDSFRFRLCVVYRDTSNFVVCGNLISFMRLSEARGYFIDGYRGINDSIKCNVKLRSGQPIIK